MLATGISHAQSQASTTFRVSASVQAVCSVNASDLDFGQYNSQNASPKLGTTTVNVVCSPTLSYQVGLNQGTGAGATEQLRKMQGTAGATLDYALYRDEARTQIWGNTAGQNMVTGTGTGQNVDHVVYGTIPAGQQVPPTNYSDTITVRVLY